MINLEEAVVRKLKTSQHILCTVESCTGGLIAHLITNVPGASEVYWGSWVTYDNSSKEELGVRSQILSAHGAVSPEVAAEMAERGLSRIQQNPGRASSYSLLKPRGLICIATTGIAGPSGGSKEKPVGLCYIGLAISGRKTLVEPFNATLSATPYATPYERSDIKLQFAHKALEIIRGSV